MWSEGRTEWQPLSSIPELWAQINNSSAPGTYLFSLFRYCCCYYLWILGSDLFFFVVSANDDVDEFERWQNEIKEAEAQVEGSQLGSGEDPERPSTPPEGEEDFTDDDGTKYKWDKNLRVWVPQVGPLHVIFICCYTLLNMF